MNKHSLSICLALILTVLILMAVPSLCCAINCSSPPSGSGGSWARAYASWCQQCGGTYNPSNQSCSPGSNWGGGNASGPYQTGPSDEEIRQQQEGAERQRIEAERQRQQEIEEQRRQDEAAAKIRQEQFEQGKQNALKSMKGITEGELGLKGSGAGDLGLKDIGDTNTASLGLKDGPNSASANETVKPECEWGSMNSSVVDLRCLGLDPNKPVTIDPHVVRGEERVFPVQIDPTTFENANYNKGFEGLMRFDIASAAQAVKYFKQAQKERPNDPLVRNGLLLAQDILKARKQKKKDDEERCAYFTLQSYAAMMTGDNEKAIS